MVNVASGRLRDQLTGVKYNDRLLYCFKTSSDLVDGVLGVSSADLVADLGHVVITEGAATGTLIGVLGANAPKPPRMSRVDRSVGRTVSTFCATDKVSTALRNKWTLAKRGRTRGILDSIRRKSVYVELFGLFYVWKVPDETFTRYGALCGLKDAQNITTASEFQKVIYGANRPKPGVVTFRIMSGAGSVNKPFVSLFYDPTKQDDLAPLANGITIALPPPVGL